MEMNSSNPEKFFVNLKLLPPIDPHAPLPLPTPRLIQRNPKPGH
ncbi:hypothetical protein I3842_01G254200 [Carya illinoinensis]|uniref:Uncharacterized protein n=1 Tax=Carya illinoinensis TaxID=32201 RepID=A0A922K5T9_CARIL|nr:hypothetical protein I3842_01G254200 [Carya illinoinensis]